jgi:hypothetical protein
MGYSGTILFPGHHTGTLIMTDYIIFLDETRRSIRKFRKIIFGCGTPDPLKLSRRK